MLQSFMLQKVIGSTIRHGATAIGSWLVIEGYADEQTAQAVSGGLLAVGGLALSYFEKRVRF